MKKPIILIWSVILLFLINSCNLDSLDFNKLSDDLNLNPEFTGPIAKANITIRDLGELVGGGPINVDALHGSTVPFPSYSFNGPYHAYEMGRVDAFTSITIAKGSLEFILENKLKVPVSFTGCLFDLGNNRKILDNIVFKNVAPKAISKVTFDLAGTQISNNMEFRLLTFSTPGSTTPVYIDKLDFMNLTLALKNFSIQ